MLIAKTMFNNNKYEITLNEGKVEFIIKKDNGISKELNENEINILSYIYDRIRVESRTCVFMSNIKIQNKKYSIFMDKRNSMYTLLLNQNGKYYIPSDEENTNFNMYFNYQPSILYDQVKKDDDEKKAKKDTKFFTRFLRIGSATLAVLVASKICLAALPETTKYGMKYNIDSIMTSDFTKTDKNYNYSDIVSAIESNNNISQEEKEFLKESLYREFEENKEYMNIPILIERLKTLKTEYIKRYEYNEEEKKYEKNVQDNVGAFYSFQENAITCVDNVFPNTLEIKDEHYDERVFGFDETELEYYFHEVNHLEAIDSTESIRSARVSAENNYYNNYIDNNYEYKSRDTDIYIIEWGYEGLKEKDLKKIISKQKEKNEMSIYFNNLYYETINELFSREYYEEYKDNYPEKKSDESGYQDLMPYMYALAEILPEETLREYKFNNNISILIDGLKQIDNTGNKAYELITSINCINYYHNQKSMLSNEQELNNLCTDEAKWTKQDEVIRKKLEDYDKAYEENNKKIHDGYAYFYNKKYNKNMADDMIMLTYLYSTPIITEQEKKKYEKFIGKDDETAWKYEAKGYLSEYYKAKHPGIIVTLTHSKSEEEINIEIDEFFIGENNRYFEDRKNEEYER